MKISVDVDTASWLELPRFDEGAPEASTWEDDVVEGMKKAWRGALDASSEHFVREALRHGLRRVSDDDSVTLQYWPDASIVNAIVHIVASPFAPGEERMLQPLADMPYVTEPVAVAFETDALGVGIEARYLTTVGETSTIRAGGVNYLFQNDYGFVAIGVDATLPSLIGILLDPLREIVRNIRVVDDIETNWNFATISDSDLSPRGEDWSSESLKPV
ncbi:MULTISPECIES: hypothetical protein [unclassified Salinibacterium]|uniref:hypothetical protein n=1 Tax=unclassified Salinibacterium TaxID=2632331 RepID=UPI0018CC7C72|nr:MULTISPECIES: hypothetical protein [unclassified Salinibacterium]MBH0008880.1 hypothetical protein [Salinibacterium sp. SWN1162]MBH0082972.1 hypothetical protein [Salinibacterium sp. SWN167]